MKRSSILALFLPLAAIILYSSCAKESCEVQRKYTIMEPVYMSYDEFRSAVKNEPARSLENPGKIYIYGQYLFVNEVNEGVHIIDNSNPASPQNISFIRIPANLDMAVRGNSLYADSHMDLLAIDISDPANASVTKRINDVFEYRHSNGSFWADQSLGVVVDWEAREITETVSCDENVNGGGWIDPLVDVFGGEGGGVAVDASTGGAANDVTGKGGSMARFTLVSNYLYAIDNSNMSLFDISTTSDPNFWTSTSVGWNIETIFPYQDKLFIGSQTGMHIYDNSDPSNPVYVSSYDHIRSCDPVVVDDEYAYVTLRSGTPCQGFTNQLDIVDITDVYHPKLVTTYQMENPHGLGLDDGTLFLCDAEAGLKVFKTDDVMTIDQNQTDHVRDLHAYDVIPYNQVLILTGNDGIYQFDYDDINDLRQLSRIPVN